MLETRKRSAAALAWGRAGLAAVGPWRGWFWSFPALPLAGRCAVVFMASVHGMGHEAFMAELFLLPGIWRLRHLLLHVQLPAFALGRQKPCMAIKAEPAKVHNLLSLPASSFSVMSVLAVLCSAVEAPYISVSSLDFCSISPVPWAC